MEACNCSIRFRHFSFEKALLEIFSCFAEDSGLNYACGTSGRNAAHSGLVCLNKYALLNTIEVKQRQHFDKCPLAVQLLLLQSIVLRCYRL